MNPKVLLIPAAVTIIFAAFVYGVYLWESQPNALPPKLQSQIDKQERQKEIIEGARAESIYLQPIPPTPKISTELNDTTPRADRQHLKVTIYDGEHKAANNLVSVNLQHLSSIFTLPHISEIMWRGFHCECGGIAYGIEDIDDKGRKSFQPVASDGFDIYPLQCQKCKKSWSYRIPIPGITVRIEEEITQETEKFRDMNNDHSQTPQ